MTPEQTLEVEMLTAQLEEAGWNSVKGRATMLRAVSRYFGHSGDTHVIPKGMRKIVLGRAHSSREWAVLWVIWRMDGARTSSYGLEFYLTG